MAKKTTSTAKKRANPKARSATWKTRFFAALAECGNVSHACHVAKVNRTTVYAYRQNDPEFAQSWEDALDEATDELEAEARRRALKGVEEPVYQGGKLVGKVRKFSDTLLIFLLKGLRPERYRELNLAQLAEQIGRQQSVSTLPDSVPTPPAEPSS